MGRTPNLPKETGQGSHRSSKDETTRIDRYCGRSRFGAPAGGPVTISSESLRLPLRGVGAAQEGPSPRGSGGGRELTRAPTSHLGSCTRRALGECIL